SSDRLGDVEQYNDYAIEALESFNDKYKDDLLKPNSFESYIFGILSSSNDIKVNDIEVYRFQHKEKLLSRCMITLCLISKSKSSAIVLNTLQVKKTEDFLFFKTFLHNYYPNFATKIKRIIRITMNTNPNYPSVFTDQVLAPLDNKNNHLLGGYLIDFKNMPGVFGIVKADQTPLFISIIHSERKGNYELMARKKLIEILKQYLPDYLTNPMRGTADFVSIVTSPSSGNDGKIRGMLRVSTTGRLFKQCLPMTSQIRQKRNAKLVCKNLFEDVYEKRQKYLFRTQNTNYSILDEENENPEIKQSEKYRYSPTEELGEKLPETK
uniref:Homing endonuclease LAGLIDADG domain-containing protein n=1 Tax=Romanomermis culicivorax TaxID=13658 RepID=A0A915HTY0_ROMCU